MLVKREMYMKEIGIIEEKDMFFFCCIWLRHDLYILASVKEYFFFNNGNRCVSKVSSNIENFHIFQFTKSIQKLKVISLNIF